MINDEFEIKINEIIKYLEENGGYDYKLCNHSCFDITVEPDSNIVEYAEDIKNYWLKLTNKENLYDRIILDIIKIIYDNVKLFSLDDEKLKGLKRYCRNSSNEDIEHLEYNLLIGFVQEVLIELFTTEYLYDFRNIKY